MTFGDGLDDDDDMVSEINMTPLVDVMLVLLIIFMLTMPVLMTHAVKLDLPRESSAENTTKPEIVTISVTADGAIHWNEDLIGETELALRMRAAAARQPQSEIYLRGDRKADYGSVIKVMAAAQRVGVTKLGFVTEPEESIENGSK